MIDYTWLTMSILFFISMIINSVRWFLIRKEYKTSNFLVVITHFIAFVVMLILAFSS